mgnify:CR=1 FL=1
MKGTASTAGSNGTVTQTGSGPLPTLSGTANEDAELKIKIIIGGRTLHLGTESGRVLYAVTVRALATNQLTSSNTWRMIGREFSIASANGLALGALIGTGVSIIFGNPLLGAVIATAMLINNLIAGLAGILVPVTLDRLKIDPAVSSAVFVTMATDVMGFFSFLGLAVLSGLA